MYEFYKDTKSKRLFVAFAEYLFEGIEPTDLKWLEKTIFNSLKFRMENQRKKSDSWAIWWTRSHWWWRPRNSSSELKQETSKKQTKEQTKNKEDNNTNVLLLSNISSNEDILKENNKEKNFASFWKEYPHARKGKKSESEKYFLNQNSDEVMKQVWILKRKLRAWLIESQYIPACERWIRDFTPLNDDVIKQDLTKICRRHLKAWWDMKQRASELKQTFWEQQINEIVKAIQQKDSPKNLFLNQS